MKHRLAPTIECPCDRSMLCQAFIYDEPPPGETPFDWDGQAYRRSYDRCAGCGHWFGVHNLDLDHFYEGAYAEATYGNRMAETFSRIVSLPAGRSDNVGRCKRLLAFAAERFPGELSPSLLDVGSGLGVFPHAMKAAGWNCTALDPDSRACAHIAARTGVPVIQGDFMELSPSDLGSYDVVTLNKVIEHVEDPCSMLRKAADVTNTEGFVYVEVPDADGASSQGQDREEFFVEHCHVFSVTSLSATIERSTLRVARIDRLVDPSGKFTLACFALPKPSQ